MRLHMFIAFDDQAQQLPRPLSFDLHDRRALWRSRSARFKLAYHWNVLWAFLSGFAALRSTIRAHLAPHAFVALASKPPNAGMAFVCPAMLAEFDHCNRDSGIRDGFLGGR